MEVKSNYHNLLNIELFSLSQQGLKISILIESNNWLKDFEDSVSGYITTYTDFNSFTYLLKTRAGNRNLLKTRAGNRNLSIEYGIVFTVSVLVNERAKVRALF